jgi:hypothetical protein
VMGNLPDEEAPEGEEAWQLTRGLSQLES